MKKKRFIPFGLTLAGLTLKGKQKEISRAYYELDGEDLERRLLILNSEDEAELKIKLLELDKKYGHKTYEEYDIALAELTCEGKELEIKKLEIERKYEHISKESYDYKLAELKYKDSDEKSDWPFIRLQLDKKYGKLTEKQFDKAVYSLANRPWVDVVHSEYNDNEGSDGFAFELDWNDAFINLLRKEGYSGPTDDAIVEQWFEDKSLDNYLGFLAEQIGEMGEDPEDAHRTHGRARTLRESLKDNRTRHS